MPAVPTVIDVDTGEALPLSRGGSSSSRSKKKGNVVSNWWGGLSSEQQAGLISTGFTVGLPLAIAAGKKIYGKIKGWIGRRKGASKTSKPAVNQTYRGQTSVNYTTGGGSNDVVPYSNYGADGGAGSYGLPEGYKYADPIIL